MLSGLGLVGINDCVVDAMFSRLGGEIRVRLPADRIQTAGLVEGRLALVQLPGGELEECLFDETEADPPWVWVIFASRQFRSG